MYIPVILGTGREGRKTENAAKFVFEQVKKNKNIDTELIDVRDYHIHATDKTEQKDIEKKWAEKAEKADAFIIVSPEYNHGYPGELKTFLDMCYDEYNRKAVGIVGTGGIMGGGIMVEQLRLVSIELQMVPIRSAVHFPSVWDKFNEDGNIKDRDSYERRVTEYLEDLLWYANALKKARENGN